MRLGGDSDSPEFKNLGILGQILRISSGARKRVRHLQKQGCSRSAVGGDQLIDVGTVLVGNLGVMNDENVLGVLGSAV